MACKYSTIIDMLIQWLICWCEWNDHEYNIEFIYNIVYNIESVK